MIARYLVATGRRDAAIAHLAAQPTSAVFEELDTLGAVDVLGTLARITTIEDYNTVELARGLGRHRRFDLLRPLLERADITHPGTGALEGLWAAPAVPDDSMLVRDWIVPRAHPFLRSSCAQFLALVGDREMARALVDELRRGLSHHPETHAYLAPAAAAIGEDGDAIVEEAVRLWIEMFTDEGEGTVNLDGYGSPARDTIERARARVSHIALLARDRGLPWNPRVTVQWTFLDPHSPHRQDVTGIRRRHALDYALATDDLDAAFAAFEDARTNDLDHAPYVLYRIAENLPRVRIERDLAMRLSVAATSLVDPKRQDGGVAVIGALAEAGQLAAARALLPHVLTPFTSPNVYARLAAHTRDRAEQRALLDLALTGKDADLELAKFVDADLRARR